MEWIKVGDLWLQANLQLIPREELERIDADLCRPKLDDNWGFWDRYDAEADAKQSAELRAERQSPGPTRVPLQDQAWMRHLYRQADPTRILDDQEDEVPLWRPLYGRIAQPDPATAVLDDVDVVDVTWRRVLLVA